MHMRLLLLLAMASVLLVCKKAGDEALAENPLLGYLSATRFNERVVGFGEGDGYQMGLSFRFLHAGVLSALTLKLPFDREDVRINLWDATERRILKTYTVAIAPKAIEVVLPIEDFAVHADKTYTLSYEGNAYYYWNRKDESAAGYPVSVGSIVLTGYSWTALRSANVGYPDVFELHYYAGDLSFVYERRAANKL